MEAGFCFNATFYRSRQTLGDRRSADLFRDPCRSTSAAAGRSERPEIRPTDTVRQPSQTDETGTSRIPRHTQEFPDQFGIRISAGWRCSDTEQSSAQIVRLRLPAAMA